MKYPAIFIKDNLHCSTGEINEKCEFLSADAPEKCILFGKFLQVDNDSIKRCSECIHSPVFRRTKN